MNPARFWPRYAAYSLDLVLLAPLAVALAAKPLISAFDAFNALLLATETAMQRAFEAGHFGLLDLAEALRADPQLHEAMVLGISDVMSGVLLGLGLSVLALAAWFIGFEASPWQATPGKRVLHLQVQDKAGGHVSLGRAALRFVGAAPSWLLLHLGHAFAMWREDGRALHDLIAGTRVVALQEPMPAWARAWLALQLCALLGLLLFLFFRVAQAFVLLGL